jgi:2-dehydro-3-deoxygluconokinase
MKFKPEQAVKFDQLSLGEVMLRLDPGEGRIRSAREFKVWEGGGEYNVARGLTHCFGLHTGVVTALVDNEIGRLVENLIQQGGVSTEFINWEVFDQIGQAARNGLNFTERGFGIRGPLGVSDRGHTAISQLKPGQIDWQHIFGELGVRIFHTGGIFARLGENTAEVILEAMQAANTHGTLVSYDFNYRASLWAKHGGIAKAQEISKLIAPHVQIMIGGPIDFNQSLGIDLIDAKGESAADSQFGLMSQVVSELFPNLDVIANTNRDLNSASKNHYSAIGWSKAAGFAQSTISLEVEVLDRIGAGDSFVAGLLFGLLTQKSLTQALDYGVAHGALTMTTPGDNSAASLAEVEAVIAGKIGQISR